MKPATLVKIKKEALDNGLNFVSEGTHSHNNYVFKLCKHSQLISQSKVRLGEFSCKKCVILRFENEAKEAGLTFIEKSKGDFNIYKFNDCGHSKALRAQHVRRKAFCCSECKVLSLKTDADANGLVLLSSIPSSIKNIYKFKKCNHTQEINPLHVKNNAFCCQSCGESYANKPSGIYIIKITNSNGFSWLKFGVSKNIKRRMSEYKLKESICEVILNKTMDTNSEAVIFEKGIHKKFKNKSLCSNKMKKLMKSGFTECYNLSMLDNLVDSLKSLSLN
jgi:hypothetical protein